MLIVTFLSFSWLITASAPLCIQGCCNRSLQLHSNKVFLYSDIDTLAVELVSPELPCCECSDNPKEDQESQARPRTPQLSCGRIGTFHSYCPIGACPQDWCECPYIKRRNATLRSVRTAVGCDVLPLDFPLCPIGECRDECFCREVLLRNLHNILFPGKKTDIWIKGPSEEEIYGERMEQQPIDVKTEF